MNQRESARAKESLREPEGATESHRDSLWLSLALSLAHSGSLWLRLALSGPLWLSLGHSGYLWLALRPSGRLITKERLAWPHIFSMFCCKTVEYDSVLSRNVKIRHFLSRNVKIQYFLSRNIKIRAMSWKNGMNYATSWLRIFDSPALTFIINDCSKYKYSITKLIHTKKCTTNTWNTVSVLLSPATLRDFHLLESIGSARYCTNDDHYDN